jgi:hypothetical protein
MSPFKIIVCLSLLMNSNFVISQQELDFHFISFAQPEIMHDVVMEKNNVKACTTYYLSPLRTNSHDYYGETMKIVTYNKHGWIIEENDSTALRHADTDIKFYQYDRHNKNTGYICIHKSSRKVISHDTIKFDGKGRKISRSGINATVIYSYHKNLLLTQTTYDYSSQKINDLSESKQISITNYTYDEKKNLIKEEQFVNGLRCLETTYRYDSLNRVIEKKLFDVRASRFRYKLFCVYDEWNNMVRYDWTDYSYSVKDNITKLDSFCRIMEQTFNIRQRDSYAIRIFSSIDTLTRINYAKFSYADDEKLIAEEWTNNWSDDVRRIDHEYSGDLRIMSKTYINGVWTNSEKMTYAYFN